MFSLWFSNQERKERTKHCFWLFAFFIGLSILLICWTAPILADGKGSFPLSKVFSFLKSKDAGSKTFKYLGLSVLVFISFIFVYKSILEIFSLVTPPTQWRRAKRYLFLFTALALAPLLCCTLVVAKDDKEWKISNATQYFFFQFYFFIANRIGWRFFIKFLLPEITGESSLVIKKIGGKLTRQHYLGWTAFFLLAFYLPIWALLLVVAIALFNNSFSFLFGRKVGTTRLSEYSPTKTLEGSIFASFLAWICFSVLAISFFKAKWFGHGNFAGKEIHFFIFAVLLIGAISFLTNWGDCTFSLCKRALGYKNFGRLFGTQVGGFWDRFDSLAFPLFFTSIVFWIVLAIIKKEVGSPFSSK
ncbi:hypothetical protein DNK47_01610 [Mycoplasma wenyonii]|uniref:Phosphatidate cytidylyltransferase n=1 Tax=Mycoplasma wenyonii TaxID=65123 RepID=A0A328PMZ4_9MOLU|nr:phosphatidate cytidylyltransferase [Mycoplasma wenyonii]RAO95085.1 hypothetical protein DNK47_01610 [Mycoplasma wenyonii]